MSHHNHQKVLSHQFSRRIENHLYKSKKYNRLMLKRARFDFLRMGCRGIDREDSNEER